MGLVGGACIQVRSITLGGVAARQDGALAVSPGPLFVTRPPLPRQCDPKLGDFVERCDGNASKISACQQGFYVDQKTGKCAECKAENCEACDGAGKCAACGYGYGLDAAGKCVPVRATVPLAAHLLEPSGTLIAARLTTC